MRVEQKSIGKMAGNVGYIKEENRIAESSSIKTGADISELPIK
ncbi:MAG: hypothetical protein PVH61_35930 [Candidatus Aminicenantes bacterium]